jgi:hypothetical protein
MGVRQFVSSNSSTTNNRKNYGRNSTKKKDLDSADEIEVSDEVSNGIIRNLNQIGNPSIKEKFGENGTFDLTGETMMMIVMIVVVAMMMMIIMM